MNTTINPKFSFTGIHINQGGLDFVQEEGGEAAVAVLEHAQKQFAGSRWSLYVKKDGYFLESPNKKEYKGPFSVKKRFKTGKNKVNTTKLVVRMDETNRAKFPIELPSREDVTRFYNLIKKSSGINRMIHILSVLESRC